MMTFRVVRKVIRVTKKVVSVKMTGVSLKRTGVMLGRPAGHGTAALLRLPREGGRNGRGRFQRLF